MPRKKPLESVSICTVVSFGRSSECDLKIAIVHTVGSVATVTVMGNGKKGGTNFTPNQTLRRMLETSGVKATVANTEIGESNEQS
jgi:hypothetical protein